MLSFAIDYVDDGLLQLHVFRLHLVSFPAFCVVSHESVVADGGGQRIVWTCVVEVACRMQSLYDALKASHADGVCVDVAQCAKDGGV